MILADSRKFVGTRFGLSISIPPKDDPDWPRYYGEPEAVINQFVFTEGCNFLFEGGRLVLGHRWHNGREEGRWDKQGVLNHLVLKAKDCRAFRPVPPSPETGKPPAALLNFLAWPDQAPPDTEQESQRMIEEGVLEIRPIDPVGFDTAYLKSAQDSATRKKLLGEPLGQYARIRALTAMRREMVRNTDFRICIGGAVGKNNRRLPGVIEEAIQTCEAHEPLYISGAFGGVAKALADCLLQRRIKLPTEEVFFTPGPIIELMGQFAAQYPVPTPSEGPSVSGGWNALEYFQGLSLDEIATQAGLTKDQYINLLATPDIERAMAWIMTGVGQKLKMAAAGAG